MPHSAGRVTPIQAVLFDLDGTLVETEALKAASYARAAVELRPGELTERAVIEAYEDMVGRSRREVATALMERFALEPAAAGRMDALGVDAPWKAYVALRLRTYEAILADHALLRAQEYTHATALLRRTRDAGFPIGVATMSHLEQAGRVLAVLGLRELLDALVTRDDVERPKPDPEIYHRAAALLGAAPERCLAIEDSVPGIRSALAAGMRCIAMTTALTRAAVHASGVLPADRIVDEPELLARVVLPLLGIPPDDVRLRRE